MAEQVTAAQRVFSTVAPFGFNFDTERLLRAYKHLGCTAAQYYANRNNPPDLNDVRRTFDRAGLAIDSTHGIYGADIDPASPDPAHREHCLHIYEREADIARELGAHMVVVHPAAHQPTTPDAPFDFPKISPEDAKAAQSARTPHLIEFLRRLADIGEKKNTIFIVENMGYVVPIGHDAALLGSMVATIGSRYIRMCFDTGHAHFTGDVYDAIKKCAPVVGYIHLHDNNQQADNHLMPGDGTIDWNRFAEILNEHQINTPCMLEVFEDEDKIEQRARDGKLAKLLAPLFSP